MLTGFLTKNLAMKILVMYDAFQFVR